MIWSSPDGSGIFQNILSGTLSQLLEEHFLILTTHSRSFLHLTIWKILELHIVLSTTHSSQSESYNSELQTDSVTVMELDRVELESTVTVSPLHLIAICVAAVCN